jgi:ribosome-associated translation inhibitor RaiA
VLHTHTNFQMGALRASDAGCRPLRMDTWASSASFRNCSSLMRDRPKGALDSRWTLILLGLDWQTVGTTIGCPLRWKPPPATDCCVMRGGLAGMSGSDGGTVRGDSSKVFDEVFLQQLVAIESSYRSLPKQLQIRVERWVSKLSEPCSNDAFRRNRNLYGALLVEQTAAGKFSEPFHRLPESVRLPMLPSHLSLRVKAAEGRQRRANQRPRSTVWTSAASRLQQSRSSSAPAVARDASQLGTALRTVTARRVGDGRQIAQAVAPVDIASVQAALRSVFEPDKPPAKAMASVWDQAAFSRPRSSSVSDARRRRSVPPAEVRVDLVPTSPSKDAPTTIAREASREKERSSRAATTVARGTSRERGSSRFKTSLDDVLSEMEGVARELESQWSEARRGRRRRRTVDSPPVAEKATVHPPVAAAVTPTDESSWLAVRVQQLEAENEQLRQKNHELHVQAQEATVRVDASHRLVEELRGRLGDAVRAMEELAGRYSGAEQAASETHRTVRKYKERASALTRRNRALSEELDSIRRQYRVSMERITRRSALSTSAKRGDSDLESEHTQPDKGPEHPHTDTLPTPSYRAPPVGTDTLPTPSYRAPLVTQRQVSLPKQSLKRALLGRETLVKPLPESAPVDLSASSSGLFSFDSGLEAASPQRESLTSDLLGRSLPVTTSWLAGGESES